MTDYPESRDILVVTGAGYRSIPSLAAGASVLSSGSAHTYGGYATVVDPVPFPMFICGVQIGPSTTPGADVSYHQYSLGVGVATAENQIAEFKLFAQDFISGVGIVPYPAHFLPIPIFVPGGVRVAARHASGTAAAYTHLLSLIVVKADELMRMP